MNRREAERFLAALADVRASGGQAAVATVIRVHGSAYRREGARMLVRPDGTYVCALSGGCLEPAVADAAARVLATGKPAVVRYDLADDSIWGLNIGCTGAVDIRIERVEDDEVTHAWLGAMQRGEPAVLLTALSGTTGRRLVRPGGDAVGRIHDPAVEAQADARARAVLAARRPVSGIETLDGAEVCVEVLEATPEIVVFGAGQDAVPLAEQAWALGFNVTIVDPRAAYLQESLFPHARRVLAPFEDLAARVTLPRGAFAVVMSHHMDRDRLALRHCIAHHPAYIGVLGPRARFDRLLADLREEGIVPADEMRTRIHSPVGLSLGAEAPEEVAVSILAEILAVRYGFTGGFLREARGAIHREGSSA